jgi:hypothetical protein
MAATPAASVTTSAARPRGGAQVLCLSRYLLRSVAAKRRKGASWVHHVPALSCDTAQSEGMRREPDSLG